MAKPPTESSRADGMTDDHVTALIQDVTPATVQSVLANQVSSSYFQACAYVCTRDCSWFTKTKLLLFSMALVLFQVGIAGAIFFGTARPLCTANSDCPVGTW
jgi:hypothetical protein